MFGIYYRSINCGKYKSAVEEEGSEQAKRLIFT